MIFYTYDILIDIINKLEDINDIINISMCNKQLYYTINNNNNTIKFITSQNEKVKKTIYKKINNLKYSNDLSKLSYALKWLVYKKYCNCCNNEYSNDHNNGNGNVFSNITDNMCVLFNIQNNFIKNMKEIKYDKDNIDKKYNYIQDDKQDLKKYGTILVDFLFYSPDNIYIINGEYRNFNNKKSNIFLFESIFYQVKKYISDDEFFMILKHHLKIFYEKYNEIYKLILHKNIELGKGSEFYYKFFDIVNSINHEQFSSQLKSVFYETGQMYDPSKYENFNIMDADGDIDEYCRNFYVGHLDYSIKDINYLKNTFNI